MEKVFKRSLLGAAIASLSLASVSAHAYKIGDSNDMNVEIYGVAAISVFTQEDDNGYNYENESRVGFRAGKQMTDNIEAFMQIESGWVLDGVADPDGHVGAGELGQRDTFVGLRGDWGSVRFGRMLTPLYELIDWPYSNPGLGRVFDWGGDVGGSNYDRKSDMARYDSPQFGDFSFSLAAGRGTTEIDGSDFYGAKAHYRVADVVTFHAGFETADKFGAANANATLGNDGEIVKTEATDGADTMAYLVGFEASLPAGFGLAGAMKYAENKDDGVTHEQYSYSVIGQYWNGPIGVKVGYAMNDDSELGGVKQDNGDEVLSAQLMAVIDGFVPYIRIGQHDAYNAEDKVFFTRVGLEYGF